LRNTSAAGAEHGLKAKREMSSSYPKQKPFQTLHDLVAPGDMDKRLTHGVSSGSCRDQRNHVHHTAVRLSAALLTMLATIARES
jgi:hypothetical protein